MSGVLRCRSGASCKLSGAIILDLPLDLRVDVEEGVEATFELSLNLFAGALDQVHRDVSLMAIGQLQRCVLDLSDLALW